MKSQRERFEEIQEYARDREDAALEWRESGMAVVDIAEILEIGEQRVYQLLRKAKARRAREAGQ